jgi:prolyl-tRNA editing enzyme YbaK/EbsC (Cys-tRNA(Pro) deacylase)
MNAEQGGTGMSRTHVDAVVEYLQGMGVEYELIEHDVTMSANEEAKATRWAPEQVAKTVVLHDGNVYAIAAIPGSDRLDLHKLRAMLGASRHLRLASEDEIARDFPALEVGAIPPFGPMVPAVEVIDSTLARQPRIVCPAGDHRHSVAVDPREVIRLMNAKTGDICEE